MSSSTAQRIVWVGLSEESNVSTTVVITSCSFISSGISSTSSSSELQDEINNAVKR